MDHRSVDTPISDSEARAYLERIRWPQGPRCPHCGADDRCFAVRGRSERYRPGLWKCGACRRQFTVTVGTAMHGSKVPLSRWVQAFRLICSRRQGISALQLQRDLQLGSYRTAWRMVEQIRQVFANEAASERQVDDDTRTRAVGSARRAPVCLYPRSPKDALRAFLASRPSTAADDAPAN